MIVYLRGKIIHRGSNYIILDVHDVGYKVFSNKAIKQYSNRAIELFIYHHIKEDRSDLYGFKSREELAFFENLIKVNGVGPKMATNILSKTNIDQLKQTISKGDIKLLTAIGGVGKKIAGKIIIELKNKFSVDDKIDFSDSTTEEVLSALSQLGYKQSEIVPYLTKIPSSCNTSSQKVKWILKNLK